MITPKEASTFLTITIDEAIQALEYIKSRGATHVLSMRTNYWIGFVERNQEMSERHVRGVVTTCTDRGVMSQYDVARVLAKQKEPK
jgi:hypothetical protein